MYDLVKDMQIGLVEHLTVDPVIPGVRPLFPSPVSLLTAFLAVLVTVLAAEPTVEVRLCSTPCMQQDRSSSFAPNPRPKSSSLALDCRPKLSSFAPNPRPKLTSLALDCRPKLSSFAQKQSH